MSRRKSSTARDGDRAKVWWAYGRLLAALRAERDWSQQELACRADVSGGLIAGYEGGEKRYPAYEHLARVAAALGYSHGQLMAAVYEATGVSLLEGVAAIGSPPDAE